MNENMRKRNEVLAQTVIKGLESRNISGYYAKDKEDETKMDYVADLLDYVCGWISNEQYKLWNLPFLA